MRLEPIDATRHGDDLFALATTPDAPERFRYLREGPPESRAAFDTWLVLPGGTARIKRANGVTRLLDVSKGIPYRLILDEPAR